MTPIEKAALTAANPKPTNPKDTGAALPCMQESVTFDSCGNSRVSFDELNTLSGHRPLIISAPFFMPAFGLQLVGRMLGGFIPAGFLECRFVNLTFGWPFLFDDEKGEHITLGGQYNG